MPYLARMKPPAPTWLYALACLALLTAACSDDEGAPEVASPTATVTRMTSPTASPSDTPTPTTTTSPTPTATQIVSPDTDLTVATLNILHGITCPPATRQCRLSDRVELLFQWIVRAGCPDVVTLQEMWGGAADMITLRLARACPFAYEAIYIPTTLHVDDEMILSRYPVTQAQVSMLYGGFRSVLWARLDHPVGALDVFSTHLSSDSDLALDPCTEATHCPAECMAAGTASKRDCQALQLRVFVEEKHDVAAPAVIAGDFNESPGSFVYRQFVDRGWSDVYLAAGNPECDPSSGAGCTSGREDERLVELESPGLNQRERIDFIFLVPPAGGSTCRATIDSNTDSDGDGTATGAFAGAPNPFVPRCGVGPLPICWPSDHIGVQLDLNCE